MRRKKQKIENKSVPMNVPEDIVFGALVLLVTGNKEAEIQNYRGILEYTDEVIAIQGKKQVLIIRGSNLLIEYFTNESMKVMGQIDTIEYDTKKMRWKR